MTMSRTRYASAALVTALTAAQLAGCATTLPALPRETPPRFTVQAAGTAGDPKLTNLDIGSDARTGTGVGAVYGAASGLQCGPWAIVCVPAGFLVGALVGSGTGAVVGATGSLSAEKAAQVRERLVQVARSHDLTTELHKQLAQEARPLWAAEAGAAGEPVPVEVTLRRLTITSTRAEQIGLVVEVEVAVAATIRSNAAKSSFACNPGPAGLAQWLDPQSDLVDSLLAGCMRQLAAQIVGELARSR